MSEPLTLYIDSNRFSPYAMWAYVALKEKRLPFALRPIDLAAKQHHESGYEYLSLTGKVPTLLHGDFALAESSAIIEYLEDVFPVPPVLPSDPKQRARARQLQAWLRSDLMALREERPTTVIFKAPIDKPLSEAGRAAADKLIRVATSLVAEGAEYLFGAWCIADTELALTLNRLVANGDPVPANLKRYVAAQWVRPSVQAWLRRED
ncbi:MAG: glutathione transferase [Betaproteobacteria bacterium]|nr:glutathione transferase [Betaproteobacteria bacterium]